MSRKAAFIFLILFTMGLASNFAHASKAYDWTTLNSNEIKMVTDPKVEEQLRIDMIDQATSEIDLITYDLRDDETGRRILSALRRAADRNVKVRVMSAWSSHQYVQSSNAIKSWKFRAPSQNKVQEFLLSPPTQTPIEYFLVGGPAIKNLGFKSEDGIHEKLLIIDQSHLLYTGRGYGDAYSNWQDLAFALKGKDLVLQAKHAYEDIWSFVEQIHPRPNPSSIQTNYGNNEAGHSVHLNAHQRQKFTQLSKWLNSTSTSSRDGEEPLVARLLHSDHLSQLFDLMAKVSPHKTLCAPDENTRLNDKPDSIMEEMIRLANNPEVKEIRFTTLAFTPPPKLKNALLGALARGAKVEILMNSKESHVELAKDLLPYAAAWYAGLKDTQDLVKAGAQIYKFKVGEKNFLHEKLLVVDDVVMIGSHNWNTASNGYNDEVTFEFKGQSLSEEMKEHFAQIVKENGELVTLKDINAERSLMCSYVHEPISSRFKCYM